MRTLKLGLALGAGGTKGAAHVGVMKVLQQAGIPVDVIAGTSIGALYGGAMAAGYTTQEMEDGIRTYPRADVIRFFLHRLKIRDNNRLSRYFYDRLAGLHIEKLPTTFGATASDIVEHRSVTITSGPLIDAIEASIAIPMIARPVMHQGRYLLDGGFWDSAPVDAAVELGADVVVAIELGDRYQMPMNLRAPATWVADRMQSISLRRSMAGVPFTLNAVMKNAGKGRTADFVIRPPHLGGSPFQMVQCLDAGIAAAQEALPSIRALLAGEPLPVLAEEPVGAPRLAPELA
jgi:NTE family protein